MLRWEKATQLDAKSWADGEEGVRTWCVALSEQHMRISERTKKGVGGKGTGGCGIPMCHNRVQQEATV